MGKSLAKIEQSELGALIDKREELQAALSSLKRSLKYLNPFDAEKEAQARDVRLASLRTSVDDYESKSLKYQRAESLRLALLEQLGDGDELVRELLKQGSHNSFQYWSKFFSDQASNTRASLKATRERFEKEPIEDPRIKITNSIGDVEYELAKVRAEIKARMPK